jgi:hypothetical protein
VCGLLRVKRDLEKPQNVVIHPSSGRDSKPAYPECELGYHSARSFFLVYYKTFCHLWWPLTLSDTERSGELNFTLAIFGGF